MSAVLNSKTVVVSQDDTKTSFAMKARSSVVTAMLGSEEALKPVLRTTYEVESVHRRLYTGGKLSVAGDHVMCLCGGQVSVMDVTSHALLSSLEPLGAALSFALHPSGHSAVTCGGAAQLQRWDLITSKEEKNWKLPEGLAVDLDYDSSGTLIASAGSGGVVHVWDSEGAFCTHRFRGHSGPVLLVRFAPVGVTLVSAGQDLTVRVWDLHKSQCKTILRNHMSPVTSVIFLRSHNLTEGPALITAGRDKVLNVWAVRNSYKHTKTIPTYEIIEDMCAISSEFVCTALADANSDVDLAQLPAELVLTTGDRGAIRLWDAQQPTALWSAPRYSAEDDPVTALVLDPVRATLHCATLQHVLHAGPISLLCSGPPPVADNVHTDKAPAHGQAPAWELAWRKLDRQVTLSGDGHAARWWSTPGNNDDLLDTCYLGQRVVAVATNSTQVRVYRTDVPLLKHSSVPVGGVEGTGHQEFVLCLAASPCCRLLATGSKDNTIRLWRTDTLPAPPPLLTELRGHTAPVSGLCFSRRAAHFLVSVSEDRTLKVWPLAAQTLLTDGKPNVIRRRVQGAGAITAQTVRAHERDINAVTVSPNSRLIATASQDRTIALWQLPGLQLRQRLHGHRRGVWAVQFSPVDQVLASASGDQTIRLWSLSGGTCLRVLQGHAGSVLKVAFLPGGMQLMSTGADGLLKLWNVRSAECVSTFDKHIDRVWAMAISVDGAQVVTGGTDSVLSVWADRTKEVAAEEAAEYADRVVKQQELSNLLLAKRYTPALVLALQLELPRRALNVLNTMEVEAGSPKIFQERLLTVVGELTEEQLGKVLMYARDWNTNTHHCLVAHQLLAAVLRRYPPHKIAEFAILPRQQCKEFLAAMLSYTERHQERVRALSQSTYLLDHTLDEMRLVSMSEDLESMEDEAAALQDGLLDSQVAKSTADTEETEVDAPEVDISMLDAATVDSSDEGDAVDDDDEVEEYQEDESTLKVITQTRRRSSRVTPSVDSSSFGKTRRASALRQSQTPGKRNSKRARK